MKRCNTCDKTVGIKQARRVADILDALSNSDHDGYSFSVIETIVEMEGDAVHMTGPAENFLDDEIGRGVFCVSCLCKVIDGTVRH